jgi:predicted transcriptional regulator of viral defense system
VTKQQSIVVSDPERTIIDALRQPQYAGGIPEIAKALWMGKSKISVSRLLEYALRFHNGALMWRLGFLLELYQMVLPEQLEQLRSKLTSNYDRLDPTLPKSGSFQARWHLQLNIDIDELEAIPHT